MGSGMNGMSGMNNPAAGGRNGNMAEGRGSTPSGKPETYMYGSTYGMTDSNVNGPRDMSSMGDDVMDMMMYGMEIMGKSFPQFSENFLNFLPPVAMLG